MPQEEKDLLLQDLSARLPYGVMCKAFESVGDLLGVDNGINVTVRLNVPVYEENDDVFSLEFVKPYLRPMSSMTDEEEIEYDATFATIKLADGHYDSTMTYKSFDFLNAHHFDYRALIDRGLAIEVTEENNPYGNS